MTSFFFRILTLNSLIFQFYKKKVEKKWKFFENFNDAKFINSSYRLSLFSIIILDSRIDVKSIGIWIEVRLEKIKKTEFDDGITVNGEFKVCPRSISVLAMISMIIDVVVAETREGRGQFAYLLLQAAFSLCCSLSLSLFPVCVGIRSTRVQEDVDDSNQGVILTPWNCVLLAREYSTCIPWGFCTFEKNTLNTKPTEKMEQTTPLFWLKFVNEEFLTPKTWKQVFLLIGLSWERRRGESRGGGGRS